MRDVTLGVNGPYHETAAAVAIDGRIAVAIEEERLTRRKHGKEARIDNPDDLPWRAIEEALRQAGVSPRELRGIGYSLEPGRRARLVGCEPEERLGVTAGWGTAAGEAQFDAAVRRVPVLLAERLGIDPSRVRFLPHHVCHAASAFLASPCDDAAVLVLDGIGEDSVAWLGEGRGAELRPLEEAPYPHSLGLLWERFAAYLGFGPYDAAKVMGLAAYGDPEPAREAMSRLVQILPEGSGFPIRIDAEAARLRADDVRGLESLFGARKAPDEPFTAPRLAAVARALQERTTEAVLATARELHRRTGLKRLCYAGGVALNCVTNAALEREGPFEELHLAGAAHDAGTAVGAALLLSLEGHPERRVREACYARLDLGPPLVEREAAKALVRRRLPFERMADTARLGDSIAEALAAGELVGVAEGRVELGPRALGRRSVLADPRSTSVRDRLNAAVKKREPFRPFGAAILEDEAEAWLDLPPGGRARESRRLMILAYPVREDRRGAIPAVVHVDGTCRIQTVRRDADPLFHAILRAFHARTGVPLVLNTSFNDREPIVASAEDALTTALAAGLDRVVLGPLVARLR